MSNIGFVAVDSHKENISMDAEIWKDIDGFLGCYQISNIGRVKSLSRHVVYSNGRVHLVKEKIIRLSRDRKGYLRACLVDVNKKKYSRQVHRLVAKAFLPNPQNLPQVNHINEIHEDNRVENLEWCTAEYNLNYGNRNRLASDSRGKDVIQFTLDGKFVCRHTGARNAARALGLHPKFGANIASCAHHKRHVAYGYKWEWA